MADGVAAMRRPHPGTVSTIGRCVQRLLIYTAHAIHMCGPHLKPPAQSLTLIIYIFWVVTSCEDARIYEVCEVLIDYEASPLLMLRAVLVLKKVNVPGQHSWNQRGSVGLLIGILTGVVGKKDGVCVKTLSHAVSQPTIKNNRKSCSITFSWTKPSWKKEREYTLVCLRP